MKKLLTALWLVAVLSVYAGVGTVDDTNRTEYGAIKLIPVRWESTAVAGTDLITNGNCAVGYTKPIYGEILRVVQKYSSGTTTVAGSITVKDSYGFDLLSALGTCASGVTANIAATMTNTTGGGILTTNFAPWCVNEPLLVTVTNCGSNAVGFLYFYVR